jgi:hypothetical protein
MARFGPSALTPSAFGCAEVMSNAATLFPIRRLHLDYKIPNLKQL